jgi:hypothetical protein
MSGNSILQTINLTFPKSHAIIYTSNERGIQTMLKMNYSDFSSKTFDQIEKAAKKRGINPYRISREDLIGMIIAHDAYYEGKEDARREISTPVKVNLPEKRAKYHLTDGRDNYYLELTDSQVRFFEWLKDYGISPYDNELEAIEEMTFEAP